MNLVNLLAECDSPSSSNLHVSTEEFDLKCYHGLANPDQ